MLTCVDTHCTLKALLVLLGIALSKGYIWCINCIYEEVIFCGNYFNDVFMQ